MSATACLVGFRRQRPVYRIAALVRAAATRRSDRPSGLLEQAARKGSASSAKNGHGCAHHRMGVKGGEHVVFNAEGALDLSRYLAALERWSAAILAM
jgi:hypothetical protein